MEALTEYGAQLVRGRIERDTIWCMPCGLSGRGRVLPVTVYAVSDGERIVAEVPACRACLDREFANKVNIASLRPVEQPEHVAFLHSLATQAERS